MAQNAIQVDTASQLHQNLGMLQAGSPVTIELSTPAGQKGRFRTYYIGYLPKKYVLIQYPDSTKLGKFSSYIKQGLGITVRALIEGKEGAVVAFVSVIRQTLQTPSRILVVDFPTKVTIQKLRDAVRIETDITAAVLVNKQQWRAQISDISAQGCHLYINNGEELILTDKSQVDIVVEGYQSLDRVKISAVICNSRQLSSGISFGVRFDEKGLSSATKLLHCAMAPQEN